MCCQRMTALHEILDHSVGFATLEILRHGHAHQAQHGLPEIAQISVVLDDVPLVLEPQPAAGAKENLALVTIQAN